MTSPSTETHPPAAPKTPVPPRNPRPPRTQPPPPKPKPSKALAEKLDTLRQIEAHLISALALAASLPDSDDRVEVCGQEILKFRIRRALAARADLAAYLTPARRDLSPIGAGVATQGGPVPNSGRDGEVAGGGGRSRPVQATRLLPGECLAPGSGAAFSGAVTESAAAVVAGSAGALPPAGQKPPLPGGAFLLPESRGLPSFEALLNP